MTGTQFGDVRRYDTRAARKPVSNWAGIGKVGGVKAIAKGLSEQFVSLTITRQCFFSSLYSELFVSDSGSNLSSIDLRTGGILYSYKGISHLSSFWSGELR